MCGGRGGGGRGHANATPSARVDIVSNDASTSSFNPNTDVEVQDSISYLGLNISTGGITPTANPYASLPIDDDDGDFSSTSTIFVESKGASSGKRLKPNTGASVIGTPMLL